MTDDAILDYIYHSIEKVINKVFFIDEKLYFDLIDIQLLIENLKGE